MGDDSVGEFYSVALTHHAQQADTGTKMIHLGRNTKSTIISKGISAGRGQNSYRGLVKVERSAHGARNSTQCDSLLIGKQCGERKSVVEGKRLAVGVALGGRRIIKKKILKINQID